MFSALVVFYLPGDEVSTGGDGKLSSAAWSLGVVQTWLQSLILTPSTCDLSALLLEPQCSRGREVTLMTAVRIKLNPTHRALGNGLALVPKMRVIIREGI